MYTLTTIDNKFNPFTEYDKWFAFDADNGYYTDSKVARLANLDDSMSEKEQNVEWERCCDRLINLFPGVYKRVYKNESST